MHIKISRDHNSAVYIILHLAKCYLKEIRYNQWVDLKKYHIVFQNTRGVFIWSRAFRPVTLSVWQSLIIEIKFSRQSTFMEPDSG
jgi:hypothetical protein